MSSAFDKRFQDQLRELFRWRRDVRRFRSDAVERKLLHDLLGLTVYAPSVGLSQPWRFVNVENSERRDLVIKSFKVCNREALDCYDGEAAKSYAQLKLEGLKEAPVHLAVFSDMATDRGRGLGQKTMPETLRYSCVTAIYTFWLAARAEGLGVGWVSILNPDEVAAALDVPADWSLVAYLCVGWPEEEHLDPELERAGWEERSDISDFLIER
jgi:5,6-dimethylbenzimidazole synthase